MSAGNSNERLLKFLQATPEQQAAIDRILAGNINEFKTPTGPLLMPLSVGAKFLGISRSTLARMIQAGKLNKVEILPGYFGVRRTDLEAIAATNYEPPKTTT
jgi:DNA invertase Pin-like site-specific DNA recombinase